MDKRTSYRTPQTLDFSTQLLLDGRIYSDIAVTNLSLGGCCLKLPATAAVCLRDYTLVEELQLSRPFSGPYPVKARIAWHARPWLGGNRWVKVGLQFLEAPERCVREVRERVAEGLFLGAP
jgi:hypothetical protein